MKTYLIVIGVVVLAVLGFWLFNSSNKAPEGQACTTEAKICPDGTAVGRTGPNCEFATCPTVQGAATSTVATIGVGGTATINGVQITALNLVQDSRCPVDVQCIQAGTVTVRAAVDSFNKDFVFTLGEAQEIGNLIVKLESVTPAKNSKETIKTSDYRFTFSVTIIPKG